MRLLCSPIVPSPQLPSYSNSRIYLSTIASNNQTSSSNILNCVFPYLSSKMTHNLPVRSRDDMLFGNKGAEKKKDPEPTAAIKAAMDGLDPHISSVDEYKSVGNMCYGHGMFSAAIRYYTKTIEMDPDNHVHYSNRSAAYVNSVLLSGPSLAFRDASKCVELSPAWFKGHLRKADALFAQDKLDEAIKCYSEVIKLNPDCTIAVDSRKECMKRQLMQGKELAPEHAPYAEGSHGQSARNAEAVKKPNAEHPTEQQTDDLIKTWTQDTDLNGGKTATKKYGASVAEADRDAGRAAKEAFMNRFKKKVETDQSFGATVRDSLEKEKLAGAGFDYRTPAQQRTKQYANGTDEVGAAISADCYKSYTYRGTNW